MPMNRPLLLLVLLAGAATSGCITVDPETDEPIPRGDQHYPFDRVEELADGLQRGMTKIDVTLLLGSAAEESEDGRAWIYLPERAGIVIPARALKLEFKDGRLDDWGYHPIVLGQRL